MHNGIQLKALTGCVPSEQACLAGRCRSKQPNEQAAVFRVQPMRKRSSYRAGLLRRSNQANCSSRPCLHSWDRRTHCSKTSSSLLATCFPCVASVFSSSEIVVILSQKSSLPSCCHRGAVDVRDRFQVLRCTPQTCSSALLAHSVNHGRLQSYLKY